MLLLEAIAHEEGFYKQGTRPQRNNNPGDLVYGNEAIRFGSNAHDAGYAIFPSVDIGWNALRRWLSIPAVIKDGKLLGGYLGATLEQVVYRFAPPVENNSAAYLQYIVTETGFTASTILTLEMLGVPNG